MLPVLAVAFAVGLVSSIVGEKTPKTSRKKIHRQSIQKPAYNFEMKIIPQEKKLDISS